MIWSVVAIGASLGGAQPSAKTAPVRVGDIDLTPCAHGARCGTLVRPLDPLEPHGKTLSIYFEWFPHRGKGASTGTLVATEGGPGFPATESREDYLSLFAPLRDSRDVLIMDNRGTGKSGAIDCRPLQQLATLTTAAIGACGASLGASAPLYSTAFAADDLAAILQALRIERIDLYGDSYGTYFAQVFAVRHPQKLRSLIVDGAYPLDGQDYAWYLTYAPAMRDKFNLACQRSSACSQVPGASIDHIRAAVDQLRAHPAPVRARNSQGDWIEFMADTGALATAMFSSAPAYTSVRDADAAARAYVQGDTAPLFRVLADAMSNVDSRDPSHSAKLFSAGLAAAVMCQDTPQVFDMRLSVAARRAQFSERWAVRERATPALFSPFTFAEYRRLPLDYSFIEQCIEWPVSDPRHPASHVIADNASYPQVPTLVISGEFDNLTTVADGAAVAKAFPNSRQVILANSFHVNALPRARSDCGARVARHFIETLEIGDTSCASRVPALKLAEPFAQRTSLVEPATARAGNAASQPALRCARAAVLTAADAMARMPSDIRGRAVGLRGGDITLESKNLRRRAVLASVRWTEDLPVSGFLEWEAEPEDRRDHAVVRGQLRMQSSEAAARRACGSGDLRIEMSPQHDATSIEGSIDGMHVAAEMRAP